MLPLYRAILRLYPANYRAEYAEEMLSVLQEVWAENKDKNFLRRGLVSVRETCGLLLGATREHVRNMLFPQGLPGSLQRRLTMMRSEFRFPKSTVALMTIILVAVMMIIEKAKAISQSVQEVNPPIVPIQPAHVTIVPTFLIVFAGVCLGGALVWAVLFALRRSGIQRLSNLKLSVGPR